MTTQYADLSTVSGQTLTANLFAVDGDTILFTADSVTERTNAKGVYRCTFGETSAISGTFRLIMFSGAVPMASGIRVFAGADTEVAVEQGFVTGVAANAITASSLATDAVGEIADGVWDEAYSGHTTAGTYGGRIVRATNSNVEVLITGSNHIAADVTPHLSLGLTLCQSCTSGCLALLRQGVAEFTSTVKSTPGQLSEVTAYPKSVKFISSPRHSG